MISSQILGGPRQFRRKSAIEIGSVKIRGGAPPGYFAHLLITNIYILTKTP
jgi:hypothetical protein